MITHGKPATIGPALARLATVAREAGVELLARADEAAKHGLGGERRPTAADLAVVLGGDGTMLRALDALPRHRRAGDRRQLRPRRLPRLDRAPTSSRPASRASFAGEYDVVELPTLEVEVGGERSVAVNDVVVTSGVARPHGRARVGGRRRGARPAAVRRGHLLDAVRLDAYNLSNGGPVLVWGLDAMAVTFVAPHSLHARPLVVPRGRDVVIWNRTPDVSVDGARRRPPGRRRSRPGGRDRRRGSARERSLLATLPEATFFRRYRDDLCFVASGSRTSS